MTYEASLPHQFSIAWLRKNYLDETISPDQVISTVISRAIRDQPMNIWITPPDRSFIQPYIDRLADINKNETPLWGIPFAIKDNIDLVGIPTTAGCPDYAYIPSQHATVVKNLIRAGAIPIGKTNLDQFATGLVGTRSPYGEVHNAFKDALISGGSSAGSAVAVARGQAAFALGTDTAGSGRVPAALNGLFGFKPSCGAWSTQGVVPACASLDCVTVFARTVEDIRLVDQMVRTFDDKCPWSRAIPFPEVRSPLTIYLPHAPIHFFGSYQNEYQRAWERIVRLIQESGWPVKWIDSVLFDNVARLLYDSPMVAERWADLGTFVSAHPGSTFPVTEKILKSGTKVSYTASSLFSTMHTLAEARQETKRLLRGAVYITPTVGGTWTREQVRQDPIWTNNEMGIYTNHCNLLDLCAISVPLGNASKQMPFGATFFATSDHEDYILTLAERVYEKKSQGLRTI